MSPYEVQDVKNAFPTWTILESSSHYCECGYSLKHNVHCRANGSGTKVDFLFGYCMTLENYQNTEVVGPCPFNCGWQSAHHHYLKVPSEPSELDKVVVGTLTELVRCVVSV